MTQSISELFEAQSSRTPSLPSILMRARPLLYAALNTSANQIARYLLHRGAGPGVPIVVALPRSFSHVAVMLGTWKIGAIVVPIDVTAGYDTLYLKAVLADVDAMIVVTTGQFQSTLFATLPSIVLVLDRDMNFINSLDASNVCMFDAKAGEEEGYPPAPPPLAAITYAYRRSGTVVGAPVTHMNLLRRILFFWRLFPMTHVAAMDDEESSDG